MTADAGPATELADRLDRELTGLPHRPPTAYLHAGHRARRRRRRTLGGAVVGVGLALVTGAMVGTGAGGPDGPSSATDPVVERAPSTAPTAGPGLKAGFVAPEPDNPVRARPGLQGVEAFSTDEVPSWAEEYGNHGPVSIAPDGRLWVAPEAVVRRTVLDPLRPTDGGGGVTASYAVEAEFGDRVVWVLLYTDGRSDAVGTMDDPGRWTTDFELWVDNETASLQDRPSFGARLVRFRAGTDTLVAATPGVTVVRQVRDVALSAASEQHPRSVAAEVEWRGTTWFVLAQGPRHGQPWYDAYEPAVSAPDLDGFLTWLRSDR